MKELYFVVSFDEMPMRKKGLVVRPNPEHPNSLHQEYERI